MLHWFSIVLIGKAPLLKISNFSIFKGLSLNNQYSSLVAIRDHQVIRYPAQDSGSMRDKEALLEWMRDIWLPVFPELTVINIDEITKKHIVVLVVFYQSGESKQKTNLIKSILREWQSKHSKTVKNSENNAYLNSIQFAWVNGITWKKWLYKKFRLRKTDDEAKVIFYKPMEKRYWSKHSNNSYIKLNKRSVLDFLEIVSKYTGKGTPDATGKERDRFKKKRYYIAITIYVITVIILVVCLVLVLKKIKQWKRKKTTVDNKFLVSRFD
ncbi:unnamed protein product [Pneumocystis jirovecii]|nr:unnamed protein product [Pneumocystis jirovecii]